jgi:hypothetical protein
MSSESQTAAPEIRRNPDGTLDEIVASGCEFHLEHMSAGQWWMSIRSGGVETHVTLYTRRDALILANVIDHAG